MSRYMLEHEDEGARLEEQSQLSAYSLHEELTDIDIAPRQTVLDAGCGTGVVCRHLAERFPDAVIEGCDFSEIRLKQAKDALPGVGLADRVKYYISELSKIQAENNTYDHVVCRYVFEHLTSHKDVLNEFYRVLRPHGSVHIINFDGLLYNLYPMSNELQVLIEEVFQKLPYDLMIGRKIPHMLSSVGFKDVRWRIEAVQFADQTLEAEIGMTEKRLHFVKPTLAEVLNSKHRAEQFCDLYCSELRTPGATLFYNKFIVHGKKPATI